MGEILPGNWCHPLDGLESMVCWCRQDFHCIATAASTWATSKHRETKFHNPVPTDTLHRFRRQHGCDAVLEFCLPVTLEARNVGFFPGTTALASSPCTTSRPSKKVDRCAPATMLHKHRWTLASDIFHLVKVVTHHNEGYDHVGGKSASRGKRVGIHFYDPTRLCHNGAASGAHPCAHQCEDRSDPFVGSWRQN